jgi:4-amino-4-deoxy-L-arabinose transferase-like glycosyltransferase
VNRRWFPLFLILLLALSLRLVNLGGRSLWYDEAFAVLFSEKGLNAMLYGTLTPVAGGASDIHPLLYYSTLNIWMTAFGESAFAVRLWSVLLGVTTVAMMYLLAKELFGEKTALVSSLITAIAPFHIQYSQETRMYALLGLLLMVATWCFVKGWRSVEHEDGVLGEKGVNSAPSITFLRQQGFGWWLAFGLLAALAMYTQQLAAFYLAALGLIPVVRRRWVQFRWVIGAAAVAIIIYLPWLVNLPGQFQKVRSYYWIDKPSLGALLRTLFSFFVVNLDIPKEAFVPALIGAVFLAIFLIVQLGLFLRRRRSQPERTWLLLVVWLAVVPPALMWLVSQIQPVYLERSLLPSALMLYLVVGWTLTKSGIPKPIAWVLGAISLAVVFVGLYYQFTWATFPNSPFPAAAEYIRANLEEGDVIIHQNKLSALPMIYADRSLPQHFIGDTPGSPEDTLALPTQEALKIMADECIQSASRGSSRIWWVIFDFAEKQYADANRPEFQRAADWLNGHYTLVSTQKFNDLDVILFADPHGDLSPSCEAS